MRQGSRPCVLLLCLTALFFTWAATGCTTAYLEEQRRLYWDYRSGRLSEEDYQRELSELKASQPHGGVGGIHEEVPEPLIITE